MLMMLISQRQGDVPVYYTQEAVQMYTFALYHSGHWTETVLVLCLTHLRLEIGENNNSLTYKLIVICLSLPFKMFVRFHTLFDILN